MNRIIGILLLSILNVITTIVAIGLLWIFIGLGDFTVTEFLDLEIGFFIFIILYLSIEIMKWIVYVLILMRRNEKIRYYLIGYGLLILFIAIYLQFTIPLIIGLLYFAVVYLLKETKITVANDYLLFDEKPAEKDVQTNNNLSFTIGLTLLAIVSLYITWTSLEATFVVISYGLKLGIFPLLHLLLEILLFVLAWISLYKIIKNNDSNWKYYFAGLFIINLIILIWRTYELSKLEYFMSAFMMLNQVNLFMMGFNLVGFLLLIRKNNQVNKEAVDL